MNDKVYKIKISRQVERDLDDIELYMRGWGTYQENIDKFINYTYDRIESLATHPFLGESLSEKTVVPTSIRYLIVDDHLIFYDVIESEVRVYRIISQRRDYVRILGL